jgi:8-oxo-dGTP pyrophosphatase MutT (NUDIX family)/nicotinamide mononucleotide adenylyltransferase
VSWGVVIGRFQTHELTPGHLRILSAAYDENGDNLLVLLGTLPAQPNSKNPLPFYVREALIRQHFPDALVLPITDCARDDEWVKNVDALIRTTLPHADVNLYYGRDSFWDSYRNFGAFRCKGKYVPDMGFNTLSGTDHRASVKGTHIASEDFRAGMIHAVANRFPAVFPTVDIAVMTSADNADDRILLGRKASEGGFWRLPGGFVDVADRSMEAAAARELKEETGIVAEKLGFLCSVKIDDWRSRGSENGCMTTLFASFWLVAPVFTVGDDLDELKWFDPWEQNFMDQIVNEHVALVDCARKHL